MADLTVCAIVEIAIPFPLIAAGEGEISSSMPPAEALASLALLGTFCLFTALVGEVGPGRATVIT